MNLAVYIRDDVDYPYVKLTTSTSTSNRTANSVKVTMSIKIEVNGYVKNPNWGARLYVKYNGTTYLNILYVDPNKGYSSQKGKYSTWYNATHTFTITGLSSSASTPKLSINSTCTNPAWDSFIWTVPSDKATTVSIPAATIDIKISGSIKNYTSANSTRSTDDNAVYPASGKRIWFDLSGLRCTGTNCTPNRFMIYAEKFNRNSDGGTGSLVGFVTDRLVCSAGDSGVWVNFAGVNWKKYNTSRKYFYIDITDDERGKYKFKINVVADCDGVTNSLAKHSWTNGTGIVYGKGMTVNMPPSVNSIAWTSNEKFANYTSSKIINTSINAWTHTTNNIVCRPSSQVFTYCTGKTNTGGVSISGWKAWFQKNDSRGTWVEVSSWDDNGYRVFSSGVLSSFTRGSIAYKSACIRIIDSVGDHTDKYLYANVYINKLPYIYNLYWSASKFVTTGSKGTQLGWGDWRRSNIIIPSSGTRLRLGCCYYSYYTSVTSINASICGRDVSGSGGSYKAISTGTANSNNTNELTSGNGMGKTGPWCESYLDFSGNNYSGTSKITLTDALGESSSISFTYTITKNTVPSFSKIEWTASKFVTPNDRWSGNLSSGYKQEDLFLPSSGSTVTIHAYYSNSGASIVSGSRQFYREGGTSWSAGGSISSITGGFSTSLNMNSGWLYSGSRVVFKSPTAYIKDALDEAATIVLWKWVYLNTPPSLSNPEWTADNYLKRIGSTGEVSSSKSTLWMMTNEDMIIPSYGCNNVIARCKFTCNVALKWGRVRMDSGAKSVDSHNNKDRCWWDGNSYFHGNIALTSKRQGQHYEHAEYLLEDILGDTATATLGKWVYVNTKPTFSSITWTADKYVLNSNKNSAITGGVNATGSYVSQSITIPSAGSNVTIWAKHAERSNIMAPIRSRQIWDGGSSGSAWTEWSNVKYNAQGIWATRKITSKIKVPYARITDYLDEQANIENKNIECLINTKPKITDFKWSASKFIKPNAPGTVLGSSNYCVDDMTIHSNGATIYGKAVYTHNAGTKSTVFTIGNSNYGSVSTASNSSTQKTVTGSLSVTGSYAWVKDNRGAQTIQQSYIKVTDVLGDYGEGYITKWVYRNIKPNISKIQWTSDKYISTATSSSIVTNKTYVNTNIITASTAKNIYTRASFTRPAWCTEVKTTTLKLGSFKASGSRSGNYVQGTIPITATSTGFEVTSEDYLGEKTTIKAGNTITLNTIPVLSDLCWSSKNYVKESAKGARVKDEAKTNENIITATDQKVITINANVKNSGANIKTQVIKLGSLTSSNAKLSKQPTATSAALVSGTVTVSDATTSNFAVTVTDYLNESRTITLNRKVTINTKPTFKSLDWYTSKYIIGANSSTIVTDKKYTTSHIITATTALDATFRAQINNAGAYLSSAKFSIKNSSSSNYNHTGTMSISSVSANPATATCSLKLNTGQGKIYNAYQLVVTDALGEGFTRTINNSSMITINTKPAGLVAYVSTTKYINVNEDTNYAHPTFTNKNIITASYANKVYVRITGNKTGGAAMGSFTAKSGSITTSKTLNESSAKSFSVDFNSVTVTATANASYTFEITVTDKLGESAPKITSPKITINTKPSWKSGSSIYINNENTKNVVVSKSATSATILAKTANTKAGGRIKSYVFKNTSGIKAESTNTVNTSNTTASYTFSWPATEGKQSKFTCYIVDILGEQSTTISSPYALIVNTRPRMKGSIYVAAPNKDDKTVVNNMMTNSQLYIKTTNNGKTVTVSWDAPTLYNGAKVKNYNFYVSTDNGSYQLKSSTLTSTSTGFTTSFEINNVHTFRFKITCVDSYGDLSSNELVATHPVYTNVKPSWPSGAAITIGGKNYTHYYAASTIDKATTTVAWTGAADKGAPLSFYRIWSTNDGGSSFLSSYKDINQSTKSYTFKFADVSTKQGAKFKFKIRAYDALNEASPDLTHNWFIAINKKPVLTFTAITSNNYVTNRNRNDKSIIVESGCKQIKVAFKCVSNDSNGLKNITIACSDINLSNTAKINYNKGAGVNFTADENYTMAMKNYSQGKEIRFTITASDGLDSTSITTPYALYNTIPWFTGKPTVDAESKYGSVGQDIIVKSNTSYINIASTAKTNGAPLTKIETNFVRVSGSKTEGSTVTTNLNAANKIMSQSVTHKSNISSITQGEKFYFTVKATDELGEYMVSQNSYIVTVNTKPAIPLFNVTSDKYLDTSTGIITASYTKKIYVTATVNKTGSPIKSIKLTNVNLNSKTGSIGGLSIDNINKNSYTFNKTGIDTSGCLQDGKYCYNVVITDVLGESNARNSEDVLYNTIPSFDKPLVSAANMIYTNGKSGDIIVKSNTNKINVKANNVKTAGASLKSIKVETIDMSNNGILVTNSFTDCVNKMNFTFNKDFTADYGQSGRKVLYKVTIYDNLDESKTIQSYSALWNTVPTMTKPSATSSNKYYTIDSNNLVFNSNVKDVIVKSDVSNAGAPLVNTIVTLVKVSGTGEMTSPITYTMSANEANKYNLNKTLTFKKLPSQGSKWYFTVKSTDKLGESVTKSSNNFIYNTIPSFTSKPLVTTSDVAKFIYVSGTSGDIIVNSTIKDILISGSKIETAGAPLKTVTITPLKVSGDGSCSVKTINTNSSSYDLNENKQTMTFGTKPTSASIWYFTLRATDQLDQYIEITTHTVLWNTVPSLTKPIPYATNASDYMQDYSNNGNIIVKSTLKSISVKSSVESPGAKINTITTTHNRISGTSTQTDANTKKIGANSVAYDVALKLDGKQASVHSYTVKVVDDLNESVTMTSYNVTINTVPVINSLFINDKTTNHFILSNQKTIKVHGTCVDNGAKIASYLFKNNATGTGASAVANILEKTSSSSFNKTITIKNISNTKHTFTVTVTDELNESSSKTTAVATVNTKPYYKNTDKVFINNNNTDNPFIVAHNIDNVTVSWIAPTNVGAEITNYYYSYSTDGGKTWSNYIDNGNKLNTLFKYTAKEDLTHLFKVYAKDAMGERTDLMYDGSYTNYMSNTLLNNTIPWFIAGSTVSVASSVPCVLTNSVKALNANEFTNESITIPSTGSVVNVKWPGAKDKGGPLTNYLVYESASNKDAAEYPTKVSFTIPHTTTNFYDEYNSTTTAYHYYRILPTDTFYGSTTLVDYKNYLYSPKIVKNVRPVFESGTITVHESNANKIISSEINSITISYPKMAAKTHGLALQNYQIYISNNNGISWTKYTTKDTKFTFNKLNLVEDTQYKFKVCIYDGLEYSTELVSDTYLINTIPHFKSDDFIKVDGFVNDFDLDYSRSSITLTWSPATTKGEPVIGYRIEVQRGNINDNEPKPFKEEINTKTTATSYTFSLPYTEKKEFDTLRFRIYAYDSYSDSSTVGSYLESCKVTIKGAFQIKRHD